MLRKTPLFSVIFLFLITVSSFAQSDKNEDRKIYISDTLAFKKFSAKASDSLKIYNSSFPPNSYPNPFSPSTLLPPFYIYVPSDGNLKISIYHHDTFLRLIFNSDVNEGVYYLDLKNLKFFQSYANGTYYLQVQAGDKILEQKFIYTKTYNPK